MAGSQSPAPIVLWDHTRAGVRWRVSIHPELVREGGTVVRFLKQGRTRKLLDQLRPWGPQGWICPPSATVPTALLERIERELQRRHPLRTLAAAGAKAQSEQLWVIARELVQTVKGKVTIDWTLRENVRVELRVAVKRILRTHGYPPDLQAQATDTVIEQAETLSEEWALA